MSAGRTCFVIMPIGDQDYGSVKISAGDLRKRYDNLIKEALLKADSRMDVTRADDVAMSGTITFDILARIMHSDLVVADITYPNPNVFYEIGLRHACRPCTILIRETNAPRTPFDLSHERYIEYQDTSTGLKHLADQFARHLENIARDATRPDNHFLEYAKLTKYTYPQYAAETPEESQRAAIQAMFETPELLDAIARKQAGENVEDREIMQAVAKNPKLSGAVASALAAELFAQQQSEARPNRQQRRAAQARNRKKKP